jgi:VCBS repeat-containing protein
MATLTITSGNFFAEPWAEIFADGSFTSVKPSGVTVVHDGATYTLGSEKADVTVDGNGVPVAGTISKITKSVGGATQFALTGASLSLAALLDFTDGLFATMFAGRDSLTGGSGDDELRGYAGVDTLKGGGGDDRLDGGSGNDSMSGGSGDDTYVVDASKDVVTEKSGNGSDTIISKRASYTLGDHVENLQLDAGTAAAVSGAGNSLGNVLTGNGQDNVLDGLAGNDAIDGGDGDDTLSGGDGSDVIDGGAGDDVISGGKGADALSGGDGADVFKGGSAGLNGDMISGFGTADTVCVTGATFSADAIVLSEDEDGNTVAAINVDGTGGADIVLTFQGGLDQGLVTVNEDGNTLIRLNSNPEVADHEGTFATSEDEPLSIDGDDLGADWSDADAGQTLVITDAECESPLGSVSVEDGVITFTPGEAAQALAEGDSAEVTVTYTVSDGHGGLATGSFVIDVAGANDAPAAEDAAFSIDEDAVLDGAVTGEDIDAGAALTFELVDGPAHGDVVFNADGSFSYTPDANYSGADSFEYKAIDEHGAESAVQIVNVTVAAVDDAPVAENAAGQTNEDAPKTILLSASDIDGSIDWTTLQITEQPAHGTVEHLGNGVVVFTPGANADTDVTFSYRVADNNGTFSEQAAVSIDVVPVNDAPAASDDTSSGNEDAVIVGNWGNNDVDPEGQALAASVVNQGAKGTVVLNANGSFNYTPNANATGTDTFTYRISDGSLHSNVATVTVTINAVNDAPSAQDAVAETNEDTAVEVQLAASDIDGTIDWDTLAFTENPAHGTLEHLGDGLVRFTPAENNAVDVTFSYTVADNQGLDSAPATVSISVNSIDDAPIAEDDYVAEAITEDGPGVELQIADLLANDSDPDTDNELLNLIGVANPVGGDVTIGEGNAFLSFVPDADFHGTASFDYTITDGDQTSTATVYITVENTQDAPTVVADTATVTEDGGVILATELFANDEDVDGDALAILNPEIDAAYGTVSVDGDGNLVFNPHADLQAMAAGDEATVTVTYDVTDGTDTVESSVELTITGVNDAPVAKDDAIAIADEDEAEAGFDLLADNGSGADADVDTGAEIDIAKVKVDGVEIEDGGAGDLDGLSNGTIVFATSSGAQVSLVTETGVFSFDPNGKFNSLDDGEEGADSFQYQAIDEHGALSADWATVSVAISGENDAPVAKDDAVTAGEYEAMAGDVRADNGNGIDADVDLEDLDIASVEAGGTTIEDGDANDLDGEQDGFITFATELGGEVTINVETGAFEYDPNGQFETLGEGDQGSDSFQYTLTDGTAASNLATVTIAVAGANDAAEFAGDLAATVTEDADEILTASGTATVTDTDAGESSFVPATLEGEYGALEIDAGGNWTYSADNGQAAIQALGAGDELEDTFTVASADGTESTITITIAGTNDAPVVAAIDDQATDEDGEAVTVSITATDIDGTVDWATLAAEADHGTVTVDAEAHTLTYTPDADWNGTDTVSVTVEDDDGLVSAARTFDVVVAATPDAPVAEDFAVSMFEDETYDIGTNDLLDHACDPDAADNPIALWGIHHISNGTVTFNPGGTLTFTPTADFVGEAGFDYTIEAGGEQATGHVTINVNTNPPVAENDGNFTTDEDTVLNGGNLLADNGNGADSDEDGNDLDIGKVMVGETVIADGDDADLNDVDGILAFETENGGLVTINLGSGAFSYDPNGAFDSLDGGEDGSDGFQYTAADSHGAESDWATVDIEVTGINDAPVAAADALEAGEAGPAASGNLLGNDSDAEDDAMAVVSVKVGGTTIEDGDANDTDGEVNGAISFETAKLGRVTVTLATGAFNYDPNGQFEALGSGDEDTDTFQYTINDGSADSGLATATITVTGGNDAPVLGGDLSGTVAEDDDVNGELTVTGTATVADADTGESTFAAAALDGDYGQFVIEADGDWTYTADNTQAAIQQLGAGDELEESFTIASADGTETSVTVTITGVNDTPEIGGVAAGAVTEDDGAVLTAQGTLSIADADSDEAAFVAAVINGVYGDLSIAADGQWSWEADNAAANIQALAAGATATDTITVETADGTEVDIEITLTGVNDAPEAADTAFTAPDASTQTIAAADCGEDVDSGDVLTFKDTIAAPDHATVTLALDRTTLDFDPEDVAGGGSFVGVFAFDFQLNDGTADSATAETLTVNVPGTGFADIVIGTTGDDNVTGGAGDDTFISSAGDDTWNGGADADTANYANVDHGLTVDLTAGTAIAQGTDTLISIENVIGTSFDDFISGSAADNLIEGNGGNDSLYGKAGNDELWGNIGGADWLEGGTGSDELWGMSGADTLIGGNGLDHLLLGEDEDVDVVRYEETGNSYVSGGTAHSDRIYDFVAGTDRIDLRVFDLDPAMSLEAQTGAADQATIEADLNTAFIASNDRDIVVITANGGDLGGRVFLAIDIDGDNTLTDDDLVIEMMGGSEAGLTIGDFLF